MLPLVLAVTVASSPIMDVGAGMFVESRAEVPGMGHLVHVRAGMPAGLTLGVSAGVGTQLYGPTFMANASVGYRFEPSVYVVRPYVSGGATYALRSVSLSSSTSATSQARAVGGVEVLGESRIFGLGLEGGALRTLANATNDPKWTPVLTATLTWYIR